MVMGYDSCRKVVGSNLGAVYWMDIWTCFRNDLLKKLDCLFEKMNEKRAGTF